jgi:hypothetical protein
MFFRKHKTKSRELIKRALALEEEAMVFGYKAIEVEPDLALHMGAFAEEAVAEDDYFELEEEVMDRIESLFQDDDHEERS